MFQKTRLTVLIVAAITAGVLVGATAYAGDRGVSVGVRAGAYTPYIRHGDVEEYDAFTRAAFGIAAGLELTKAAMLSLSFITAEGQANIDKEKNVGFDADEVMMDFHWSVLTGVIQPQFLVGVSYQMIDVDRHVEDENSFGANFGLGLKLKLMGDFSACGEGRYHYLFARKFASSNASSILFGLNYTF